MDNDNQREQWGSSFGFILAAAGSAIGLGNIWKFPYIVGENGGGAFVLVYLACILVIGLPVMLCEITLGRHTQKNPVGAFAKLTPPSSTLAHLIGAAMVLSSIFLGCFGEWGWCVISLGLGVSVFVFSWRVVGAMGVVAGFVILSFYSVVAGWTLGYIIKSMDGTLSAAIQTDLKAVETGTKATAELFSAARSNWKWAMGLHFAFIMMCITIVIGGVKKGIERWSKILMPALFILLVILIIRGVTLPGATEGIAFLLTPRFDKLTAAGVLSALGHAFFTLSLGMGAMITYGSYVGKKENIFLASLSIVGLDTLIALMAGLAIFPAVFAMGGDPAQGAGLVFIALPEIFAQMPGGMIWNCIFFLLLSIAALTSGISLLEVVTAYFVDELKMSRKLATAVFGGVIFLLGCLCIFSWEQMPWLKSALDLAFGGIELGSFFDIMDHIASNWLLPLGGLFISLFVGWIWGTRKAAEEIREGSHNFADVHLISLLAGLKDDPSHNSKVHVLTLASIWGIFIRFISPVAVMIAFLHAVGWLNL